MSEEQLSSILDYKMIDSVYEEDGKVILAIDDPLDWDNPKEHMVHLAHKLDTYRCYIESGELVAFNKSLEGKPVVIKWFVDPNIPEEVEKQIYEEKLRLFRIAQLEIPKHDKEPIDPLVLELYKLLCRPIPKDDDDAKEDT